MGTRASRFHFDRLLASYLLATAVLAAGGLPRGAISLGLIVLQLGLALGVVAVSALSPVGSPARWWRWNYPLFLLPILHYQIEALGRVIHSGWTFDEAVRRADRWLGVGELLRLQELIPGAVWAEVIHLFYLSYYLLIVCSFLFVYFRAPCLLPRFLFVFLGMFLSYLVVFVAFPVVGPLPGRETLFPRPGPLSAAVDGIYALGDSDGGALPSSHLGEAIGVQCLLHRAEGWPRRLVWILLFGIGISAVYGSFHYALDIVAAVPCGFGLFWLWSAVYERLPGERAPG